MQSACIRISRHRSRFRSGYPLADHFAKATFARLSLRALGTCESPSAETRKVLEMRIKLIYAYGIANRLKLYRRTNVLLVRLLGKSSAVENDIVKERMNRNNKRGRLRCFTKDHCGSRRLASHERKRSESLASARGTPHWAGAMS